MCVSDADLLNMYYWNIIMCVCVCLCLCVCMYVCVCGVPACWPRPLPAIASPSPLAARLPIRICSYLKSISICTCFHPGVSGLITDNHATIATPLHSLPSYREGIALLFPPPPPILPVPESPPLPSPLSFPLHQNLQPRPTCEGFQEQWFYLMPVLIFFSTCIYSCDRIYVS